MRTGWSATVWRDALIPQADRVARRLAAASPAAPISRRLTKAGVIPGSCVWPLVRPQAGADRRRIRLRTARKGRSGSLRRAVIASTARTVKAAAREFINGHFHLTGAARERRGAVIDWDEAPGTRRDCEDAQALPVETRRSRSHRGTRGGLPLEPGLARRLHVPPVLLRGVSCLCRRSGRARRGSSTAWPVRP